MTTPDELIDAVSAVACIAADGLTRKPLPITEAMHDLALKDLRKAVGVSAHSRGVTDPNILDFLRVGPAVVFHVRLADLTERTAQ